MPAERVAEVLSSIHRSAKSIGTKVDQWVLAADGARRFHHRSDEREIDQMLELLLQQSLLFGDDDCHDES
jgi:hypothetical protein